MADETDSTIGNALAKPAPKPRTAAQIQATRDRAKAWKKANPEKRKINDRRHYLKYKERYDARRREWKERNKDRIKEKDNTPERREVLRLRSIEYRKKNAASVKATKARSYLKHKEARAASNKDYRERNPDVSRSVVRGRRARLRGSLETHTAADVAAIRKAQNNKCAYCRKSLHRRKDYEVDHIKPLSRGGNNAPSNLQILCKSCNRSKAHADPIVFAQSIGLLL